MLTETQFMETYLNILAKHKIPFVTIDASFGEVFVPRDLIEKDGTIYLCVGPNAVRDLRIDNNIVYCRATFNGQVISISFPLSSILEIVEEQTEF